MSELLEVLAEDHLPAVISGVIRAGIALASVDFRNSRGQFRRYGLDVTGVPAATVGDVARQTGLTKWVVRTRLATLETIFIAVDEDGEIVAPLIEVMQGRGAKLYLATRVLGIVAAMQQEAGLAQTFGEGDEREAEPVSSLLQEWSDDPLIGRLAICA